MNSAFMQEQGPEAVATRVRLRDEQIVFEGEGGTIATGADGPTFCVCTTGGALVDLLDDVPELDWRRSTTVRRFATEADREDWLSAQAWQAEVRRRGWAASGDGPDDRLPRGRLRLRLFAGLGNSEAVVDVDAQGDSPTVRFSAVGGGGPPRDFTADIPPSQWARLQEELKLLGIAGGRVPSVRRM